jgi:hypothetical protein
MRKAVIVVDSQLALSRFIQRRSHTVTAPTHDPGSKLHPTLSGLLTGVRFFCQ